MTPVASIRRATVEDWAAIRDVRLRALRDAPTAFAATYEENADLPSERWKGWATGEGWSADIVTFVAERAERGARSASESPPVFDGMATGAVFDTEPDVGHLFAMWVDPSVRGRGVGRRLVEAVIDWGRHRGVGELRLCVTEGNGRAEAVYSKAGFVRTAGEPTPLREGSSLMTHDMCLPLR
jgi:GNAT superfamily N-acetyltransferase